MDINKLTAMANRLSIPQLQQAMRDGSLPAYVGMPLLQQKVQESKQLQAAQAAGQPRPPTVAEQVDGEASQAQSVQDMMKQRALAMQGEMAGTGGIGDFVKEPEKKMALGGAVAFAVGGDVGAIYKKLANGEPLTAEEKDVLSGSTAHPERIPKSSYTPSPMPNMQSLTTDKILKPIGVDIPAYTPTQISPIAVAPLTGANGQTVNTAAQSDNRDMASRMQLGAPQTDNVATKYGTTVPAGAVAQLPSVQQPVQEPAQERKSVADYRKEYMDLAGPNQNLADLKSFLAKQGEEYTEDKKRAPWMALMQAGLATMAGTSPFALANIGAGGMKGLEAYGETQKDLKKAQDRQFDLQAKIGAAQRAEDLAALHYGTESVKFDKAEANKERLQGQHDKTLMDIAKLNNQADIQKANISAEATKSLYGAGGRGTDEQHTVNDLLEAMKADPKAYPNLRGANNAPDILKVRQAASIATGTNKQASPISDKLYADYYKINENRRLMGQPELSWNDFIRPHPNAAHMLTSQDQDINNLVYSILGKQ